MQQILQLAVVIKLAALKLGQIIDRAVNTVGKYLLCKILSHTCQLNLIDKCLVKYPTFE